MELLLLRLDAPWMSFGAPMVDQRGVIQPYPGLSMLCGLLGNALGLHHRDWEALNALQSRIRYACREDARGVLCRDFHTVDISGNKKRHFMTSDFLWSTNPHKTVGRTCGPETKTLIREMDYWAQARLVVALGLEEEALHPTLDEVASALDEPARPLFIGRKCCLPVSPLLMGRMVAASPREALLQAPLLKGSPSGKKRLWWSPGPAQVELGRTLPVVDQRDWRNQIHVGQRLIKEELVEINSAQGGEA
jgi:CRISPR system Cascade subunit CasD